MKTISLVLFIMAFAIASARSQGVLNLPPVPVTNGITGTLADSQVLASLYYGPAAAPESSLSLLVAATPLVSGYAQFGLVSIPGIGQGLPVELQIRAWDDSSGQYPGWESAQPAWLAGQILAGKSLLVEAIVGSQPPTPGPLNFPGFTISQVPEPSPAVLSLLSVGLWRAWRAKARSLR